MAAANLGSSWSIRSVEQIAEFHACEELQRDAWGFTGDLDIIPLTQMLAAQKAGGVVLGAFEPEGRLLGFCYGFVGQRSDGEFLHYSHMLAVRGESQTAGVGAALKWAQRDAVLAQGIRHMVWTYDPLESKNGYLNFSKLGVVARTYFEDLYGQTSSGLHQGIATDRVLAEWMLDSPRVDQRRSAAASSGAKAFDASELLAAPSILLADRDGDGRLVPQEVAAIPDDDTARIEIPANIQTIKGDDVELAADWRTATRTALTRALAAGFYVAECTRLDGRTYYLMRRGAPDLDT
jgi:predicted GNAT superfamily acetyltransferase